MGNDFTYSNDRYRLSETGKNKLPNEFKEELKKLTIDKEFKKRVKRDDSLENITPFVYSKIGRDRLLEVEELIGLEINTIVVISAAYLLEEWERKSVIEPTSKELVKYVEEFLRQQRKKS